MDEEELRLEYWEDTRSHPEFPVWVIFRLIGHSPDQCDGVPYLRASHQDVATVLKHLEEHPVIDKLATDTGIAPAELRACLWYCIWLVEHRLPPQAWQQWNQRVDEAWAIKALHLPQ
ncbi:MAG: hypothetical protein C7B45_11795 [Sulfobacillus acidophilus]|uniref:Uncharacterized protein n=1 Tax=Sulfobacillus acidophilus TaxID=53633 RepID=A0A2T2WG79_9FIRM|nr:MAG: hypothetical protein C7B45_11795 [Sulfobacillus acidophilus]